MPKLLHVWSLEQQHQHHLGACEKRSVLARPQPSASEPGFKQHPQGTPGQVKRLKRLKRWSLDFTELGIPSRHWAPSQAHASALKVFWPETLVP